MKPTKSFPIEPFLLMIKKLLRRSPILILSLLCVACGHRSTSREVCVLDQHKAASKYETIIIDAGHGGNDSGAKNKIKGYEEKELTLETVFLVQEYLHQLGYREVVLTRHQDTFVPLSTRADIANALNADLFVSVHYNYSPNDEAQGIEVYYYKENTKIPSPRIVESKRLGQQVLSRITYSTGAQSRGVKQENFAVIRQTKMPAILIEAGFLSNPEELKKIKDPKYRHHLAQGIAKGIDCYLESKR